MITVTYLATPSDPALPIASGLRVHRVEGVGGVDAYSDVLLTSGARLNAEVLSAARQHYVPILALVGGPQEAADALAAGANDYLFSEQLSPELLAHRARILRTAHPIAQIVQASPDGVLIVNKEGVIRFANQTAHNLFGRQELVGTVFGFPVAVGQPTRLDLITREGVPRFIEMRASAVTWQEESCYLAALRDVSEQVRLTEELEKARRQSENANAAKDMLLMSVNHELRTPLTSVKGFASTLLADDVTWSIAEWEDFVRIIYDEATKLEDLINQLLDYSKIRSGVLTITRQTTTLDAIVEYARVQLETLSKAHTLHIHLPEGLPPVSAHEARIAQVMVNLVGNAAKYSPAGGAITLSAQPNGEGIRVEVRDEGPGIPDAIQETLFEPFVRDRNSKKAGAGLGLAIAKSILEAHGSDLWIESSSPEGTVMAFELARANAGGAP